MKIKFGSSGRITQVKLAPLPALDPFATAGDAPVQAMLAGLAALSDIDATHWVTFGTLLGCIREGRLLDHDDDIDLAVVAETDADAVVAAMAGRGLSLIQQTNSESRVVNQKFVTASGIMVDIFYLVTEGDRRFDEYRVLGQSAARSSHPSMPVVQRHFDSIGATLPVPEDPEGYLAHLYGPSWRERRIYWDWVFSPPNAEMKLRPQDLPLLSARWGLHRVRHLRHVFRALSAGSRP